MQSGWHRSGLVKKTTRKTLKPTSRSPRASRARAASGGVEAALASVSRAMRRLDAQWFLFGAQALALHGAPRTTKDVDVTVLTEHPTEKIIAALERAGLVPRFRDKAFIEQSRVFPCDHKATGWKVDIVLGGPGVDEYIASRATPVKVGRVSVPLLTLEHLLVLKVFAGRAQDLADAQRILRLPRALDRQEAREFLVQLEQLVGESGPVARFDQLTARS